MEHTIDVRRHDNTYLVESYDLTQQTMSEDELIAYLERRAVTPFVIDVMFGTLSQIQALTLSKESEHDEWVIVLPLP